MKAITRFTALVVATAVMASCTMKDQEAPPLTGPSEFGTSITVTASPDAITMDGASQSLITVTVRDQRGAVLPNTVLRTSIVVDGITVDFGQLSAKTVVTGADGRATFVYTAPRPVVSQESVDTNTVVDIQVLPSGTNFANQVPRSVSIRLLPIGVVLPPNGAPIAAFDVSPATASENVPLVFDGSSSKDDGRIVSYSWTFGDGSSGSGASVTHAYSAAGTYTVTLRVTDDRGLTASTSKQVTIGAAANPVAVFSVSPTSPQLNQPAFFNAAASVAAAGRRIESYDWNFGDGSTGSGASTTHAYAATATYTVTLTVVDDLGKRGVSSQTVTVSTGGDPVAAFTTSPSAPAVNEQIFFNASSSTASSGRTIDSYSWNFGDGQTGSGVTLTHAYAASGTFTVTLTVTDSAGRTALTSRTVTISAGGDPVAAFTTSPSAPAVNEQIFFNASSSTASPGRTIVSYSWNFGDGQTGSGVTQTHAYVTSGTFTVTLTVTDSANRTALRTASISVGSAPAPTARLIVSPATASVNSPIQANGSTSTTQSGQTIDRYDFNFGDGTPIVSGANAVATHSYSTVGSYSITLTVTDSAGRTNTTTSSVTITAGTDPVASFVYSPNSPVTVGTAVSFDASASQAPQNATITRYQWTFGDTGTIFTSTVPTFSHTYSVAGTYTIELTVFDNQGGTMSTKRLITVQ